jgi:hypothetical protein
MLDQLMWKDFRNQSGILVLGLFFLAGPYGLYWFYDRDPNTLAVSVMLSLIASQITVIVMGATIIGLERQNHGLDFLLGQPIPKSKILLSKSLVCLIVAVVIWGTSLLVTAVFVDAEPQIVLNGIMQGTAITGSTLFAVAWLFSMIRDSRRSRPNGHGTPLLCDGEIRWRTRFGFGTLHAEPRAFLLPRLLDNRLLLVRGGLECLFKKTRTVNLPHHVR